MRMRLMFLPTAALLLAGCATGWPAGSTSTSTPPSQPAAASDAAAVPALDIDYSLTTLDNGLRVVIHEDRKAPLVAVNLWYHVGSKDESPGKTGFAHLFEHLMFNGSEHYDGEFFRPLENVGATSMNGTTNVDRTNYYATVPTPALDLALWLESDRMGHLLGAITQAKLDEQREVVKNEKRQGDNQPYGRVWDTIVESTYPAGHPYSWSTIGSMDDLEAATLDDVHAWFQRYYGPNNAVLVIAGDVDTDAALARVRHYFGGIAPGPTLSRQTRWVAEMDGPRRSVLQDNVPQARIYVVWNVPPMRSPDAMRLDLLSDVLGSGKNSRLYQRLVYDDQIATSVSAGIWRKELGSQFVMTASVAPGADPAAVEAALHAELTRLLADGPTIDELTRVRTTIGAQLIRAAERVGGSGSKADILARSTVFGGSPDAYKQSIAVLNTATPDALADVGRRWLHDGRFTLTVEPVPGDLQATATDVDRSRLPTPGETPDLRLPAVEQATLDNGMRLIVARRDAVPVVEMRMLFDAGYAADQFATPGTASLTMAMLDEGTQRHDALGLAAEADRLGANLGTGANLDQSYVSLSALTSRLDESVALMADVLRRPTFPAEELARMKPRWLASIAQEKTRPTSLAFRVLPPLLYGKQHAYGQPLTGSGTEAAVSAMTRDALVDFHQQWIRPERATLLVVGDTDMATIRPIINRHLGDWQVESPPPPAKTLATVAPPDTPRVYLLDRPDAQQSVILAGHVVPPRGAIDEGALRVSNAILGGNFTARLNMNLREDKGWAYGAGSFVSGAQGQRPFIAWAPVQTDRTADAMAAMDSELRAFARTQPITADELQLAANSLTRELPGNNETSAQVARTLGESVRYGLALDWYERFVSRVQALDTDSINQLADSVLMPDALTWVVVGDIDQIADAISALDLGPVVRLDADGRPQDASASDDCEGC